MLSLTSKNVQNMYNMTTLFICAQKKIGKGTHQNVSESSLGDGIRSNFQLFIYTFVLSKFISMNMCCFYYKKNKALFILRTGLTKEK